MADVCDDSEKATLAFLNHALARATSTRAGRGPLWENGKPLCRDCGEEIPAARVEARPQAERCVECQEEADRGRPS